jgi:hypothetical protein
MRYETSILWFVVICHPNGRMKAKEYLRTGCWGEYLNLREKKWQEDGENDMMKSSVICALHLILFRSLNKGGINGVELQEVRGGESSVQNSSWLNQTTKEPWVQTGR